MLANRAPLIIAICKLLQLTWGQPPSGLPVERSGRPATQQARPLVGKQGIYQERAAEAAVSTREANQSEMRGTSSTFPLLMLR
jgi:hypothetical protein